MERAFKYEEIKVARKVNFAFTAMADSSRWVLATLWFLSWASVSTGFLPGGFGARPIFLN
jgi:hypothetical protein